MKFALMYLLKIVIRELKGLSKREMFGDQTSSNIVWWPNMLMLMWVAKRLKHVWSNTDQIMDTSRWASVVRMPAPNMFDTAVQTHKTSPIKHENKRNVLSCLIECLMAFKFYQTRPNTIKHDQARSNSTKQDGQRVKCLVTKQCLMVFGRQTFPVWTDVKVLQTEGLCSVNF